MKKEYVLNMDVVAMKNAFVKKELSPAKAVEIFIAHQEKIDHRLNLVVENRYDRARAEALEYTRQYAQGNVKGKLAGIPMSMKESFNVSDMHTTGGMVSHKDTLSTYDAEAVSRLKAEGAIILCKTNTPTLCFCQETDNNLFGRSCNPWNPEYTTGGSSGGEAALIATGGAVAGFGSDIGGSIRIPSHFNGVIGFKPGASRFPDQGHFPSFVLERQKNMLGFGPIVKSVRDAALIYSVIFPEFKLPQSLSFPENLKVVTFDSFHKTHCTPETSQIRKLAEQALLENGAAIDRKIPVLMKDVAEIWQLIMSEDKGNGLIEIAYPGRPKGFFMDWFKSKLNKLCKLDKLAFSTRHHRFLSWAMIGAHLFPPNQKKLDWIDTSLEQGHRELESLLGESGVLLTPAYPSPVKKHGKIYAEIFSVKKTFRWVMPFTALGNAYGLPSIIIPCGRSKKGLPIGLQVLCRPGNEVTLFKIARFLEKKFGGYTRCDLYS